MLYRRGLGGLGGRAGVVLGARERRTRVVLEAAKTLRHRTGTPRGGRTTSPEERAAASELEAVLRAAGHLARVEAVATRPGRAATFRVLDLDAAALSRITLALCARRLRSRA